MKVRFFILTGFFSLLFMLIGYQLYSLQIVKGGVYAKKVEALNELAEKQLLRRGQILFTDKHNTSIAVALNKEFPHVIAIPKSVVDAKEAAVSLSSILQKDEAKLEEIFSSGLSYYSLVDKASDEVVREVTDKNIEGVLVSDAQYRYYPYGNLSSQLLGFVGLTESAQEPTGLYGIEKYYNERLKSGEDIAFTIDRSLQEESERTLAKLVTEHSATGGTIIIQEPITGKILAMASAPDFDPNEYGTYAIKNFINPSVQAIYEPGSVFKPLTMVAGIDSGTLTPDTTFVDTGNIVLNGKKVTNWDHKAHGKITMTNVIEDSVNTGTIFAQQKMGRSIFYSYIKKLGFGEVTNVDLPDEVRGDLRNLERKTRLILIMQLRHMGRASELLHYNLLLRFLR
jgi:cell division protein FtsI/penicillin-binding protein 2